MSDKPIYVTQPSLPDLKEFIPYLEKIWEEKWLTNNGQFHKQFEQDLSKFLKVKHINLFVNGTIALITALQALEITGEVITTPYSFVATTHALHWNGIKPVFCDIDKESLNIDPEKIESLITEQTSAIMPVHVYGQPCDNEKIKKIADKYGLKIIYDAAHAFNVKKDNHSILNWGDLSILSFHATKVFNTFEGGAIVCHDEKMKQRIDYLKNFGFAGETKVVSLGINGKMNEFQAALGLLQLKHIEEDIEKRKSVSEFYNNSLMNIDGIKLPTTLPNITQNYSYYPILINEETYGYSRDEVYEKLKENNIFSRRYFYPLISNLSPYKDLSSARPTKLLVANRIAEQVICLPIYSNLEEKVQDTIIKIIHKKENYRKKNMFAKEGL